MSDLTRSRAWQALERHAAQQKNVSLLKLFEGDKLRAERMTCDAAGLHLDYSRQRLSRETLTLLGDFAEARGVTAAVARLLGGECVNVTEKRPALHAALRNVSGRAVMAGGHNVMADVNAVLERMAHFTDGVRNGEWRGWSGERITDVVNVGIGGSDLGPRFVCDALGTADAPVQVHFISNVDGAPIAALLARLKPEQTVFVVTSKTFSTQETLLNAQAAHRWLNAAGGAAAVSRHFVAVTANPAEAQNFGVAAQQVFEFWDWVGGRYSLWSAVGLPIMAALGAARFRELLSGAHAMDEHFRLAEPSRNMPMLMGMVGVWNSTFLRYSSQVIAPYFQRLQLFVPWLQQLEMESNGKGVDLAGKPVDYPTTPVLWGDVGTNSQHAFFQMIHQGPAIHPVDFVLVVDGGHALEEQHRALLAHGLGQGAALLRGKSAERVREDLVGKVDAADLERAVAARVYGGDRPSSTLVLPRLDPFHLGALLALYEHRAYVQGVLWNINSFDQFGVQLGKQAAERVLQAMEKGDFGPGDKRLDASTRRLIGRVRGPRK
ncbi:MAG TPA: glucose-6-phosphate isomerase [Verrucomicrobiae bacterium]|nr:glucose-6-phosphate isomerase [Verrucomicrobiae bacterium]